MFNIFKQKTRLVYVVETVTKAYQVPSKIKDVSDVAEYIMENDLQPIQSELSGFEDIYFAE